MKKITLSLLCLLLGTSVWSQTTIYSETFTGQNGKGVAGTGTSSAPVYDTSGVNWNIIVDETGLTATSDYFEVQNEMYEARDIDEAQIWQSNPIDISSFVNIDVSVEVKEIGVHESSDYFDFEYSTDGGNTFTKITNFNGLGDASHTLIDDFDSATVFVSNLNGTSLVLKFTLDNNAGDEYINFDNVLATGSAAGSFNAAITSSTDASCFGNSDGTATVSVNNGTANYDYVWSNGATTLTSSIDSNTVTGLAAGTYTVTITDGTSATATASVTITEPTAITTTITSTDVSCNAAADGTASVASTGGTSPYTYLWSNTMTTAAISGLSAGTYTVTVVDASSCSTTDVVTVTEPTALAIVLDSLNSPLCFGDMNGSAVAKGTGGTSPYTFDWSNGTQDVVSANVAAQSFESSSSDTWNYTVNPVAYTASGDLWGITSSLSSITPNDGSNFWGMTDLENNNGGGMFYHTITFDPVDVSAASNAKVEFDYYTIGFDSSDELEYEVVFDNGSTWSANGTALTKSTGAWTTVSVAVPGGSSFARLRIQADQNGSDYAAIDNVRITADADTLLSKETTLASGSFTVTLTDANGCSTSANDSIMSADQLRASILVTNNPSTSVSNDGNLDSRVSGGAMPYSYLWSSGSTSSTTANVAAGTYTLSVADANGCATTTSATIGTNCPVSITPTGLSANIITTTTALIDWDEVVGTNVYYMVRYKESGQPNWQTLFFPSDDSLQISGLTPNTAYIYIVRTNCNGNWSGQAFSHFRTLTTDCSLPTGINEQWVLGTQAKLVWNASANTSKYQIRYRDTSAAMWTVINVNARFDFRWLTGLINNTTYTWQIRSSCRFDDASATRWSAPRSFTTKGTSSPSQTARFKSNDAESQFDFNAEIYPNPSSGQLNIVLQESIENRGVEVIDLSGRVVYQSVLENISGKQQIDLDQLNNGVYFLRISDNPQKLYKFILQK